MLYVNDLAPRDGVLHAVFTAYPDEANKKSDGFIFHLNGEVLLLDGGIIGACGALEYLLALRAEWLALASVAEASEEARLRVRWAISHFHNDHVTAPLDEIFTDPRIELSGAYLPPTRSCLGEASKDRSVYLPKYRALCAAHAPDSFTVETDGFGREYMKYAELSEARLTFMPPETDWSAPEKIAFISERYEFGGLEDRHTTTSITNAASEWLMIEYAGRKLVFTGDSMKRLDAPAGESFDNMVSLYRDIIDKPTLMKWPHHGYVRDGAAYDMHEIAPEYILTSTRYETASEVYKKAYPESKTVFLNCAERNVYFDILPDGGINIKQ